MPMPQTLPHSQTSRASSTGGARRGRPAVERAADDAHATGDRLSLLWIGADRVGSPPDGDADPALAALARVLRLAVDATGALAGDDEQSFVVVLGPADIAAACEAAEALRGVVERHFHAARSLTISVGVACSPPHADWTADELVALARARCAGAMQAGGNRVDGHGPGPASMARVARWPAWRPADAQATAGQQLRLF